MKKFQFSLQPLQRLREMQRDQRRVELAEAYRAEQVLDLKRQQLERQVANVRVAVREQTGTGPIDVDRLLALQRHELLLRSQGKQLNEQITQIRAEAEKRRAVLIEADQQVQVLEKLRERHWRRYSQAAAREEIKQLDEVAQRIVARESHA